MRVTFADAAHGDLMDIALYIAQDSPARALTFVDELEAHCNTLGRTPHIGVPRPELGQNVRVLAHGRYLAFYRVEGEQVRILRILHSARDIGDDEFKAPGAKIR